MLQARVPSAWNMFCGANTFILERCGVVMYIRHGASVYSTYCHKNHELSHHFHPQEECGQNVYFTCESSKMLGANILFLQKECRRIPGEWFGFKILDANPATIGHFMSTSGQASRTSGDKFFQLVPCRNLEIF